jgi:hypothetical protein
VQETADAALVEDNLRYRRDNRLPGGRLGALRHRVVAINDGNDAVIQTQAERLLVGAGEDIDGAAQRRLARLVHALVEHVAGTEQIDLQLVERQRHPASTRNPAFVESEAGGTRCSSASTVVRTRRPAEGGGRAMSPSAAIRRATYRHPAGPACWAHAEATRAIAPSGGSTSLTTPDSASSAACRPRKGTRRPFW